MENLTPQEVLRRLQENPPSAEEVAEWQEIVADAKVLASQAGADDYVPFLERVWRPRQHEAALEGDFAGDCGCCPLRLDL